MTASTKMVGFAILIELEKSFRQAIAFRYQDGTMPTMTGSPSISGVY